ncbi:MAG: 2-hydroxyacyl-CoA dehydratase family protein [Candidatus Limivicinus sp.]|nr:2-hydroxyacyl-CoA dehydratase family protein [Candidatus Limivicinus sp.]
MRDLQHLLFFENMLQEANNELVQRACGEGRLALAYNCCYIPEVLLDVEGCFGVRLRAPRCTNPDLATYYMTNRSCPYSKSILERAFEGGYNFIDALMGQECCTTMNRMEQYFAYCKLIPKEKFFVSFLDMPLKKTEWHAGYYRRQIEKKVIQPLEKTYGVDFSEGKLRAVIEQHNELCRIITELGNFRKLDNPPITGYEFHVIQLVTLTCPKDMILPYLRETLEEVRNREPDPRPAYRARVMVVGSEIDDPDFTKLLEGCGAYVVADRYCFGSIPGRQEIVLEDGKDILQSVADHYMYGNQCPRAMGSENIVARKQFLYGIAKEYRADGIIAENMKFCEYWGYERAQVAQWMSEGFNVPKPIPVCQIEKDYTNAATGQLRTRFQAFVESLEIKRIQSGT